MAGLASGHGLHVLNSASNGEVRAVSSEADMSTGRTVLKLMFTFERFSLSPVTSSGIARIQTRVSLKSLSFEGLHDR